MKAFLKVWLEGKRTVPVRCDHQVQRVPEVLSMGNDSPHMYGVRTIENEIKPWVHWHQNYGSFSEKLH